MTDLDNAAPNAGNATAPTIWRYLNESIVAIYGPWVTLSDYQALSAERDAMHSALISSIEGLQDVDDYHHGRRPVVPCVSARIKFAREAIASTTPKEGE